MAVQYKDLLTVSQLQEDVLDASKTLDSLSTSDTTAIERVIGYASRRIESYLNRTLITQRYSNFRPRWHDFGDREDPDASNESWYAWARQWPVVQIETSDVKKHDDGDRILAGSKKDTVDLFAGYKRLDQSLSDIQGELSNTLTTTPDDLPLDIRDAAVEICLHRIQIREQELEGVTSVSRQMRQETVSVQRPNPGFVQQQLQMLDNYRYMA